MTPVRLEPAALRSRVKHSTTEPLRSLTQRLLLCSLLLTLSLRIVTRVTFYIKSQKGPDKHIGQRRSPDTEKVTHIKGRILYQALIIYNYVPFQIGTSHKGKNLLPEGAHSFL